MCPTVLFFHNSVAWMKDNAITAGCNPPANDKYCPNDNVTRGEMAVFLKRLAEKKVVDAATAVTADDADLLDGKDSTAYQSVLVASTGSFPHGTGLGTISAGAPFEATSVTINSPTSGVLQILGSTGWEGGDVWFTQWLEIDEATPCDAWNVTDRLSGSGTEENALSNGSSLNSQAILEGPSGSHTVSLCLWPFSGANSLNVSYSLITQWMPTSSASITSVAGLAGDGTAPEGGPSSR
jgi:hypothetical protein